MAFSFHPNPQVEVGHPYPEVLPRSDGSIRSDDGDQSPETLLLRVIVQELHTSALLAAGAASAVNFAYQNSSPRALNEALALVVGFPIDTKNWPRSTIELQLTRDTLEACEDYYSTFRKARGVLEECVADSEEIGRDRALQLHMFSLSAQWRQTARRARYVMLALAGDVSHVLPVGYAANTRTLDNILSEVMAGHAPCTSSSGKIVLPDLAERRRSPRKTLLQTVRVRTDGAQYSAFARDISFGGIGLTRMPALLPGTPVVVELECGRSFSGFVAWSRGRDMGIRFLDTLSPTDPLIYG
ncbi:MAG: PilZ domain-containing protein [Hyphomicrobiaceae bacterium]|nr:PilZ domain-containing protein [Hyphomicrobiaceae bacterium]